MTKSGIYKITNKVNGKFYIGSSANINKRWGRHQHQLECGKHPNKHLQSSWNKHGANNFTFEVLLEVKVELLLEKEQELLDKTKCYNNQIGYNIAKFAGASMRGRKQTEEAKRKMSQFRKGKKKNAEWKKKIGDAQKGTKNHQSKLTEEQVIAIKTELFSEDRKRSQRAIAKAYGVSPICITRIKRGETYSDIKVK